MHDKNCALSRDSEIPATLEPFRSEKSYTTRCSEQGAEQLETPPRIAPLSVEYSSSNRIANEDP